MRVEICEEFVFEAAHFVPCFKSVAGHKCGGMHGHTWRVEVWCAGKVDPRTGILIDYYDLHKAWAPLAAEIDHKVLNDVPGLGVPTTEFIARWIWRKLRPSLPLLSQLVIHEGPTARCVYRGE